MKRLRKREEFAAVYQTGRRVADRYLVVYARENGRSESRVGFAVGRRVGKAVVRNLVRRRLKEALRVQADELPGGWDWVLVARGEAGQASFRELAASALGLIARATGARVGPGDAGREGRRNA
ncbi:MAG TPA: ribonuclease P protein component [Firmicutes bacterium]|nr:ribonuclease P protein component [Bacillota bacterium]